MPGLVVAVMQRDGQDYCYNYTIKSIIETHNKQQQSISDVVERGRQ